MSSYFLFNTLVTLAEELLSANALPADRLFAQYCQTKKIGSKNRKQIAHLFFSWIRQYWHITEHLQKQGCPNTPAAHIALFLHNNQLHDCIPLDAQLPMHDLSYPTDGPNMPAWLWQLFETSFASPKRALSEAKALAQPAHTDIRINTFAGYTRSHVLRVLCAEGICAADLPLSPQGLRLLERGSLLHNHLYREGAFEIQDLGSQMIAMLCDIRGPLRVLDYCAGAGGKSLAFLNTLSAKGELWLSDIDTHRLESAQRRLSRFSDLSYVHCIPQEQIDGVFDKVVVDAPCSGLGTLRRNPDRVLRLTESAIHDFAAMQFAILLQASQFVRPGGELLYITCSVLQKENENIADAFLEKHGDFAPVSLSARWGKLWKQLPSTSHLASNYIRLSPYSTKTDGFFLAAFQRQK